MSRLRDEIEHHRGRNVSIDTMDSPLVKLTVEPYDMHNKAYSMTRQMIAEMRIAVQYYVRDELRYEGRKEAEELAVKRLISFIYKDVHDQLDSIRQSVYGGNRDEILTKLSNLEELCQ